jgi:superfamily II DNA/RNA helicase
MSYYGNRNSYGRGYGGGQRSYGVHGSGAAMPPSEKITWEDGCSFEEIKEITPKTVELLKARNFTKLMPVQANTFSAIYAGKNMVARDLTGSGKTLGFCLPLVEKFRELGLFKDRSSKRALRAIILAPTRELALQVSNELKKLRHSESEFNVLTVYGGVPIQE